MEKGINDIRTIPHSMEAEQAVLGSILIDPACANHVQLLVGSRDFYFPQHQAIFAAIESRSAKNLPIDPIVVLDMLTREEVYDEAGGRNYLFQIAQAVPSTANVESYARIVKAKSIARNAISKAEEIAHALYTDSTRLEGAGELAGQLLQMLSGVNQQKIYRFSQLLAKFSERMKQPIDFISTGVQLLDKYMMLERGDYMIVGGRPSSGKTAFTIQMMLEMAKHHRVAYFSLETNPEKILDRSIANRSGVGLRAIKRHELDHDDKIAIAESMYEYTGYEIYLISAAGWTVEQVRAAAQQLRSEVVFVDYLGLISHSGKSLYEKVTGISVALHIMAQSTGITVVALSQLSRAGKGEGPDMEHLRDSGQIEQDADEMILISQPMIPGTQMPDPEKRSIRVAKNKEGESRIEIDMHFDGARQRFTAVENTYSKQ